MSITHLLGRIAVSGMIAAVVVSCVSFTFVRPVNAQRRANAEISDRYIIENLKVERYIPLEELSQHRELRIVRGGKAGSRIEWMNPEVVDGNAIYSNITTFTGQAFAQGAASGGITRMVMDDLTFQIFPNAGPVTIIRFTVANLNTSAVSVRPRLRFWNADGASLGAGLPKGPGTYYRPGGVAQGFTFPLTSIAAGVTTFTGTITGGMPLPAAGGVITLWAGQTFDNVGGTATDAQMSNFGQAIFTPVNKGSSTDTVYETTAAGSFFDTDNPAGATVNFGGAPAANLGWELVVSNFGTTAAGVTLDGRVLSETGRGLTGASVTLADAAGNSRTVRTGRTGAFRFDDVTPGQSYIISVGARRYAFTPQAIDVFDNMSGLIFTPAD